MESHLHYPPRRPSAGQVASWLAALAFAISAPGADRFPFVIPGDDASPSVTGFAALSPRPAGADGFVRIRDGHFATDAGRVRFWGFNVCFAANFPEPADAEKVAAHLAKLGANALRFHHHETQPAPRGVLARPADGRRAFDPATLERQDYFLAALHRHGIYANLNLHVGREFTEAEGFLSKGLPREVRYDKYLLYYEPRMREQFKEFCRAYLTHENPHRRLRRVDDPVIAMIEITNENSFSKIGPGLAARLPEPYRGEFQRQWNAWLARRYADSAALRHAWGAQNESLGAVLVDPAAWREGSATWRLKQSREFPVRLHFGQAGPETGVPAVAVEPVGKANETSAQELHFLNLKVEAGQIYTLSFWARAAAARPVFVDVSNQGPANWNAVGYSETLQLGTEWQRVVRIFRSSDAIAAPVRLCFKFGGSDVAFMVAGLKLQRGGDWIVLPAGQSVEARNIGIPVAGWNEPAHRDARQFMVETEEGFIREIVDFLKKDLGVRVPITASQITYHSPEIVAATCDYTDIHAYWQHPRFPRVPWDPVDWTVTNTPMERVPDADALLSRAPWRLLDRPFTISEWNIPDPHDCAASVVPFAAMVAALQDWDGVFFFQYESGDTSWYADKVQRFFSFNGQPVKLALFAACANLYRRGDLAPLPAVAAGTLDKMVPATLGLSHRIGIDPKATAPAAVALSGGKRLAAPDGRAVWDATDAAHAHVVVNTPATRAVWGLVGGRSFDVGGLRLAFGPVERDYAALVLTSLDGRPVEQAKRLLLAAVGSAENTGMGWNEARTSVGNRWGTGPAQVNGIPADVVLPGGAARVWALDGRGQRAGEVKATAAGGTTQFAIGPDHRTLWYEIERL
jgi:hypothetical protein